VQWISESGRLFNLTKEMIRIAPEVQVNPELWGFLT